MRIEMRIRFATALAGALALGGIVAPSAVADTAIAPAIDKASASTLVFSTSGTKTWTVKVTASDDSGIKERQGLALAQDPGAVRRCPHLIGHSV